MFQEAFRDKRVLVTGHTGFKGSWMCEWLLTLGAQVYGYSLPPAADALLFDQLGLRDRMAHREADVRDATKLMETIEKIRPDFVFHLAAQPLVRRSYEDPVETFGTNVMGTVNLLEALRKAGRPVAVVVITTDKCYENHEWLHGYRESDPLGGHDPYSASKAAAEIVVASYRRSFCSDPKSPIRIASARAGNVVGGGDWAKDRIVPDCIRALRAGLPIHVRNPGATRPWQHVLEPLGGYLWLGACLASPENVLAPLSELTGAFNFGPNLASNRSVGEIVEILLKYWPGTWESLSAAKAVHEASRLNLAIDKAWHVLNWMPVWAIETCVGKTVEWYQQIENKPSCAHELTSKQINEYAAEAGSAQLAWTR